MSAQSEEGTTHRQSRSGLLSTPLKETRGGGGRGRRRRRGGASSRGRRAWSGGGGASVGEFGGARRVRVRRRGRGRRRKEIYGGGAFVPGEATTRDKRSFCPGSWLHPGQKGFLGGPGKFPARGPPLVPGGSTTRDKRGPFSLVPA